MNTPAHTPLSRFRGFPLKSHDVLLLFGFALHVLLFLLAPSPAVNA